ncbi:LmeA family phospholipid-binding protein [Nocardia beijingensis]|uniref:LmeA family phospholipid-binding protein n=1 Tax=Nocardia beijingensis TaxID=95162 RepID=UPI0033C6C557
MSTDATSTSTVNRRRRALLIALTVVAVLLATVLVGGEAYARHTVSNCISSQFEKEMGSKIDVGFGPKPMLLTWIDGKVPSVKVNSDDSKFGPAVGMVVHAVFRDVDVADQNGSVIGSSSADVTWSNEGIKETLGGMVSGVSSSASTGMLTLSVLGGFAELQLKPQIVNGAVQVETMSAQLLGIGLPSDLVQGIVDLFTKSLQSYPLGMTATDLKVTDSGVDVHLSGGRTQLESASNSSDTRC